MNCRCSQDICDLEGDSNPENALDVFSRGPIFPRNIWDHTILPRDGSIGVTCLTHGLSDSCLPIGEYPNAFQDVPSHPPYCRIVDNTQKWEAHCPVTNVLPLELILAGNEPCRNGQDPASSRDLEGPDQRFSTLGFPSTSMAFVMSTALLSPSVSTSTLPTEGISFVNRNAFMKKTPITGDGEMLFPGSQDIC